MADILSAVSVECLREENQTATANQVASAVSRDDRDMSRLHCPFRELEMVIDGAERGRIKGQSGVVDHVWSVSR